MEQKTPQHQKKAEHHCTSPQKTKSPEIQNVRALSKPNALALRNQIGCVLLESIAWEYC